MQKEEGGMKKQSNAERIWRLTVRRTFNAQSRGGGTSAELQHLTFNAQSHMPCKWLRIKGGKASLTFVKPFKFSSQRRARGKAPTGRETPSTKKAWQSFRVNPTKSDHKFFIVPGVGKRSQISADLWRFTGWLHSRKPCLSGELRRMAGFEVPSGRRDKLQNEATANRSIFCFFSRVGGLGLN
jgi:hypothetical protein